MRISYSNLLDNLEASAISALSEDNTYPATNVQDQRLTTKWHSDSTTTQTFIFDLGATTSCSIFAIMGHNITSACTVTVVGNDDIVAPLTWTTSGQSSVQTITYNAGIMLSFVTPIVNRYWKFTFAGQGSMEIGRLWIGNYIDITPSSLNDFSVTKKRDDIVVYGKNRQKYASIGNGWRSFSLSFPKTSATMLTAIQTFYDTVGNHSSFIFCNFDSLRTYDLVEPCYCSISEGITFNHQDRQKYSYALDFEEDL
jgi:hypothetical protein